MGTPIPFVGQAYTLNSLNIDAQRCLNFYPEAVPAGKNNLVLRGTPGLESWVTLTGGGAIRGMYTTSTNRFFAVCGNTLSEVSKLGVVTVIGTINTSVGIVRMVDNGTQLILVDGIDGWLFTLATDVFAQVAAADFPSGNFVAFIDGYFLINKGDTNIFAWSNLYDGETWDALDNAKAEGSPDRVNGIFSLGRELWVFGKNSYEVFYNTGDADDTFQRINGTYNDVGCIAPDSIARLNTSLFWVGSNTLGSGTIWMSQGYSPVAISNHAIEEDIEQYSDLDEATAFTYSQNGHDFYCVSFPSGKKTWCYDLATGMWHERNYTDSNDNAETHRAVVQEFFNNKVYVGDKSTGDIYEMSSDVYTDNGDEIHRVRSSPHIWNNLDRVFYASFQLDMETGVGLTTGQGSDPQVMLDWSNDGGHTWSNENWKSAGKKGEYRTRVKWNRLGSARDRIFRVKITDPVKCNLIGAVIT